MLKRIRKTNKQMSRGKSLVGLDGADEKPKGDRDKSQGDKAQEDTDKKKSDKKRKKSIDRDRNKTKESTEDLKISEIELSLKKEITDLQTEMNGLKQELEQERVQNTELKALKSQQISALTFKLATAIRQKEEAQAVASRAQQKINGGSDAIKNAPQVDQQAESLREEVEYLRKEVRRLQEQLTEERAQHDADLRSQPANAPQVEYLREEVKRLEEQHSEERAQHDALSDLRSQLATAVRQSEETEASRVSGELGREVIQAECESLRGKVDRLRSEVRRLDEELGNLGKSKCEEINELNDQLATAARLKEEALEEVEKVRAELNLLRAVTEDSRGRAVEEFVTTPDIPVAIHNGNWRQGINGEEIWSSARQTGTNKENDMADSRGSSSQESGNENLKRNPKKGRCFRVTGFPVLSPTEQASPHKRDRELAEPANNQVKEIELQAVNIEPNLEKLPSSTGTDHSDLTDTTDNFSDSESDSYNRKVVTEFHRIQKELFEVRESMSVVQALNERLSNDLSLLAERRDAAAKRKESSVRKRKTASSDHNKDGTVGAAPTRFIFPPVTSGKNVTRFIFPSVTSEKSVTEPNSVTEGTKSSGSEGLPSKDSVKTPSPSTYEQWKGKEVDVKRQLLRALEELDSLRNDNKEIKVQMKHIAASTTNQDHEDFLRKTTRYTDELLREMRARDLHFKPSLRMGADSGYLAETTIPSLRNGVDSGYLAETSTTSMRIGVDSGYLGGTSIPSKLSPRISRDSGIMVESSPSPQLGVDSGYLGDKSADSATITPEHTESLHQAPDPGNHRYTGVSKLGEPALERPVGLLLLDRGIQLWREELGKPLELSTSWKSTDSLVRSNSTPGYRDYIQNLHRDYIQRHIVRSSNSIAKIRDLTHEELSQVVI